MSPLRLLLAPFALFVAIPSVGFSVPTATERIVTLGGSVTEIVFALGAGDQVVARDTSSVYPPAALALPDIGYFRTIGAEGVLTQRPTFILAAQGTGPAAQLELLKNSGVTVVHLDTRPSAETVLRNITRLGVLLHRPSEAATLTNHLLGQLDAVRLRTASATPPRVIFLMNMQETATQAACDDTAAAALITLAGGTNPLTGLSGYKPLNAESLLALDPDVILYGVSPLAPPVEPPAWIKTGTRAGRTGRIHALDLGYHLSFGPRLGEAVTEVAALLHPAPPAVAAQ